MTKFAWHVTPTKNIDSILRQGLKSNTPEEDGDLAISLFKTKEDAVRETTAWLNKKWNDVDLCIIKVDIQGLNLTETFEYELITTDTDNIKPERLISVEKLILKNKIKGIKNGK